MKVLVINGSHRIGNTSKFADYLSAVLTNAGHSVDVLDLLGNRFGICDGCLICEETGECVIDDTFTNAVVTRLTEAEAYVFAMPVYFNAVPALFKNFIDRTNCLCTYFGEHQKKVGVFLVGQLEESEGSFSSVIRYLNEYAEIMNFEMAEKVVCITAREPGVITIEDDVKDIVKTWF